MEAAELSFFIISVIVLFAGFAVDLRYSLKYNRYLKYEKSLWIRLLMKKLGRRALYVPPVVYVTLGVLIYVAYGDLWRVGVFFIALGVFVHWILGYAVSRAQMKKLPDEGRGDA